MNTNFYKNINFIPKVSNSSITNGSIFSVNISDYIKELKKITFNRKTSKSSILKEETLKKIAIKKQLKTPFGIFPYYNLTNIKSQVQFYDSSQIYFFDKVKSKDMIIIHESADKYSSSYISDLIAYYLHPDNQITHNFSKRGLEWAPYHFVINPHGDIFQLNEINLRTPHTIGHNFESIGICLLGKFWGNKATSENTRYPININNNEIITYTQDIKKMKNKGYDVPTNYQLDSLHALMSTFLLQKFENPKDFYYAINKIGGHRKFQNNKECPGHYLNRIANAYNNFNMDYKNPLKYKILDTKDMLPTIVASATNNSITNYTLLSPSDLENTELDAYTILDNYYNNAETENYGTG